MWVGVGRVGKVNDEFQMTNEGAFATEVTEEE